MRAAITQNVFLETLHRVLKRTEAKEFFFRRGGGGSGERYLRKMSGRVLEVYRTPLPQVTNKKGTKSVEGCHTLP